MSSNYSSKHTPKSKPSAKKIIGRLPCKSNDSEVSATHILAHTVLGAAVAAAGGNDALTAGLSAGGAEAAAPLLSKYLYGKEAKDLTADEKGTVSAITGLVASGVGATTGDVASTVQSGQVAQNAVENNYQTKATLKAVNKHLQKCVSNDRACIEQGISILRKTDKMLDKAFNECVQTGNAACVEQHLKNILASDASPEMKEMVKQLQRLKISGQVAGLLNETNGYASEAIKDVEAVRSGQDVGCVSGATTNCIGPAPEKTLGERTLALANELTLKQIWAAVGLKNDLLTGQEITENERQLAIASMISGGVLRVTTQGAIELTEKGTATLVKKYGSVEAKKIENNFNRDNDLLSPDLNRAEFRGELSQIGNSNVLESIMRRGDVELKQGVTVEKLFKDVIQKPINERPDPSTYLSKNYFNKHLSQFDGGATKFMLNSNYTRFGIGQTDGTSFVVPKTQADILMKKTGGDQIKLADALGIPRDQLNGDSLIRVDVSNPKNSGLRLPSGNEAGANKQWIPGGKLPNGNSEAIIDATKIKPSQIIVNPIR